MGGRRGEGANDEDDDEEEDKKEEELDLPPKLQENGNVVRRGRRRWEGEEEKGQRRVET